MNTYIKAYYKGKNESQIEKEITAESFDPIKITNTPGYIYPKHQHPHRKLLAFLSGSMDVTVEGETYHCKAGDKVFIEGNTIHSAVVGKDGCTFFWSEKL